MMTITAAADPTSLEGLRARARVVFAVDRWSREQLLELQRARVREVLEHAVSHSPYYKEALGADAVDADLVDLPTLSKPA